MGLRRPPYDRRMLDRVTAETFSPAVGEAFILETGDAGRVELSLVEVRRLGHARPGAQREPFALLFRGPLDPVLSQATYRLARDGIGELDIFLVPVGRTGGGTDYEAIFT